MGPYEMTDRDPDFIYLNEPDMIAAGVTDMARCVDVMEENRWFHAELDRLGLEHLYAEHSGGHEWDYWDLHVREALEQHARVMGIMT